MSFVVLFAVLAAPSWFDVEDVSVEPVQPPAPPAAVCQCGCGKVGCECSSRRQASPIDETVKATAVPSKRVVVYSPVWCSACKSLRAKWKSEGFEYGDGDVVVEWREATNPHAVAYPFCLDETSNRYLTYRTDGQFWTPQNIRRFVGLQ